MTFQWGLMGPDQVPSARRTRTLGLGKAVRFFNEQAVPGLGNLWFAKQLVLAALGIAVAEQARVKGRNVSNIQVANAVEALACLLTFKSNNGQADARLRGSTKLQNKDISSFNVMSKPSFYVSQPMRMATVQPLLALGLTETDGNSARFNAYRITAGITPPTLATPLSLSGYKLTNVTWEYVMNNDIKMIDDMILRLTQIRNNYIAINKSGCYPSLEKAICDINDRIERHENMKSDLLQGHSSDNKKPA